MTENEQRYYEQTSGKFAAYELLLAHMLRKTMASMSDTGIAGLREDLFRQLGYYTGDPAIPQAAKDEMGRVVSEVWTKAETELS